VKRFVTSTSIVVLVLLVGLSSEVAWSQAKKDLHQAAVDGDLDGVKTLIGQGADVNAKKGTMDYTPLHGAARNGHKEVVELLLANGADINAKERSSKTPLFLAVEYGRKEIVELLVGKGADVNAATMGSENALSMARKNGNAEIVDFLTKNGATDPVVSGLYGDEYYGGEPGMASEGRRGTGRTGVVGAVAQPAVEENLLADPNEITARIKTFPGLEQAIVDLAKKSSSEMRYWAQTRSDNRTILARAVQKQLDDEFAVVRKTAVEEKATKTTEAIDKLLEKKKDRDKEVGTALRELRREEMAGQSTRGGGRTRGSTRTSGRTSGRGYSSGYGAGASSGGYAAGGRAGGGSYGGYEDLGAGGTSASRGRAGRMAAGAQPEQLDPDTQEEIRLWEQATPDKKVELAKSLHTLTYGDFAYIRRLAVEEEAKKTTATIDGILLARQVRLDTYVQVSEALKTAVAPGQPGAADDPRLQQGARTRSGRTRGGVGGTQQQLQGGRRGRR